MNSHFKFPRRVRIHGGECGAVARALHHEVKGSSLYQADSGKALGSTNERKQMSTKITLKRIALVAVSALGLGLLSVMPQANAATTLTTISVGTVPAARAGGTITVPITVNASVSDGSETLTVAARVISAPLTGGAANAQSILSDINNYQEDANDSRFYFSDSAGVVLNSGDFGAEAEGNATDDTSIVGAYCPAGGATAATTDGALSADNPGCFAASAIQDATSTELSYTYYLTIKPDLAGTYSVLVSASAGTGGNGDHMSYKSGDVNATFTFTTNTAPASVTLTNIGGTTVPGETYGALVKVTLKDSAGGATALSGAEAVKIATSSGYISKATNSGGNFTSVNPTTGALSEVTLGVSDFVGGMAFLNVKGTNTTAAATLVLTATGTATLSSAVTGTLSVTSSIAPTASLTWQPSVSNGGTPNTASDYAGTYDSGSSTVDIRSTATSVTLEFSGTETALETGHLEIRDIKGHITGAPGSSNVLYFDTSMTWSASDATETTESITFLNAPLAASASSWSFNTDGDGPVEVVSFAASAVTNGDLTVSPDSIRLATGGANTFIATYTDQFGNAVQNVSVTVTASGRNSAKAAQILMTNADGEVTYSFTDTGTNGTSDTLTFNGGSANATTTATITYGTAVAGSVMVDTPSTDGFTATTAGLDTYPRAYSEISAAAKTGASAGGVTVTALVKDASGNVMAGMPVTWTVTGTGCAITSTTSTGYTNSEGQDSATLYAWIAGNCVVTATSGGLSDEANSYWAQTGVDEARSIAATVSGNTITATVKDRFGNTIYNVPVYVSRVSGTGFFGSSSGTNANTGLDGTVSFVVTGGAVKATVGFATSTSHQSDAAATRIDGTSTASTNTFTAYAAGTATTAETGVGDTLSAAGVNSVTVDVSAEDATVAAANAASDAAAEAIDAANAATDAANLAAEAADAATVAAEEARDAADAATAAVEELATQVATLMAALKAQITTLANTVAKIAKKVKA
jgi:hypothetical protein